MLKSVAIAGLIESASGMSTCLQLAAMFFMLPPLGASESADLLWGHISRSHSLCQGTLGRLKFGFRQGRFEVFRARKPYVGRLVHQRARRPELAESSLITGFDMIRLALHGGKVASGQHFRALETLAAPGKGLHLSTRALHPGGCKVDGCPARLLAADSVG